MNEQAKSERLRKVLLEMAFRGPPNLCWCIESPNHTPLCREARAAVEESSRG